MTSLEQRETTSAAIRDVLSGGIIDNVWLPIGVSIRHGQMIGCGWHHMAAELEARTPGTLLNREHLLEALVRLNPGLLPDAEAAAQVVDILDELVAAGREQDREASRDKFMAWLRGEGVVSMPDGSGEAHVKLLDFEDLQLNAYGFYTGLRVAVGDEIQRLDLLLCINGLPLVFIATGSETGIVAGLPELFVPVVFTVSADDRADGGAGGAAAPAERVPVPTHAGVGAPAFSPLSARQADAVTEMLRPQALLDAVSATKRD